MIVAPLNDVLESIEQFFSDPLIVTSFKDTEERFRNLIFCRLNMAPSLPSKLAPVISHESNEPLNFIPSKSQLLKNDLATL